MFTSIFILVHQPLYATAVWGTANAGPGRPEILMVMDDASQKAYIQIAGPSDRWFAWGYDATIMSGTYATISSGSSGALSERVLGNHNSGTLLTSSVTVLQNCVSGNRRYILFSRPLAVAGRYSFNTAQTSLPMIWAHGESPGSTTFTYHGVSKGQMSLPRTNAPQPHFTESSRLGGRITLSLTNVLYGLTNHLEISSTLLPRDWSAPLTIWRTPPCGPPLLTYMTNLTFAITNDANFYRIRR